MNIIERRYDEKELYALKGLYNASMSKTIIGQFDMLMSGRIHGAFRVYHRPSLQQLLTTGMNRKHIN